MSTVRTPGYTLGDTGGKVRLNLLLCGGVLRFVHGGDESVVIYRRLYNLPLLSNIWKYTNKRC